ncbi:MAG: redox-regulated ATPase YchF [Planctomycetes bacterium]|nr:redox-regulated ATPase YchF [Planctomycetota bacterium]MCW8135247.1 redox-regulated ATPase YchF [Planctomycetota bacterium]
MGFKCGIVGLPNVGKSTLFNAITASEQAAAANYPFCTINPNTGTVTVPDARIDKLVELEKPAKIVPATIQFEDIAGLVEGASKNEGLGNKFLAHIRDVDAIAHVVRCFDDPNVIHVSGSVNPERDIRIIQTELALKDLETVTKRIEKSEKLARGGDKEEKLRVEILNGLKAILDDVKPARLYEVEPQNDYIVRELGLLTRKPVLYVANVGEGDLPGGNQYSEIVKRVAAEEGAEMVVISSKIEGEIARLGDPERKEFMEGLGLTESGLDRLIHAGYKLLGLRTYFTAGPKEVRAWTIRAGDTAPVAAGKIHSDFEKGFIRAETISYEDYVAHGGEVGAKEAGRMRTEGKDYIVQDGDVMHFRFNV